MTLDDYYKQYFGIAYEPMKALLGIQKAVTSFISPQPNYIQPTTPNIIQRTQSITQPMVIASPVNSMVQAPVTTQTTQQPITMNYDTTAQGLNGRIPSPTEINPTTGKVYATNPQTGQIDEAWFYNIFIPNLQNQFANEATVKLYNSTRASAVNDKAIETQATKELNAYYGKKLDEAQGDVNRAIGLIEEDYQTGKRRYNESADTSMRAQITASPVEMRNTLGNLNARGLLGTRTVEGAPNLATKLSTGEMLNAEQPTVAGFGGIAGKEIGRVSAGQQARAQAIAKTLSDQMQEIGTSATRQKEDLTRNMEKTRQTAQEQKAKDIAALTAERYAKALNQQNLKAKEALGPYLGRYV